MTRGQIVIKNIMRNRRRTFLTTASVAISTFLLAIFCATYRYLSAPSEADRYPLVLLVSPRVMIFPPPFMPISYRERIEKLPGVATVTPVWFFPGHYGSAEALVPAIACDPEYPFTLGAVSLPREQREAFLKERTAAIAERDVAKKYGWKVGDPIHLNSLNYRVSLDLVLRGIYISARDETYVFFHWAYLNEAVGRLDKTPNFEIVVKSAEDVPRVMKEVDELFRNANVETRTETVRQTMLNFLSFLGNVKLILIGVSGAVVFTILLIVANTMAMSIRERTAEIAVLRALGFQTSHVLGFLIAESLAISLVGAAPGCLAAWMLFRMTRGYTLAGLIPLGIQVDSPTVMVAIAVATSISLASTFIPAYRASRTNIAEALRYVG